MAELRSSTLSPGHLFDPGCQAAEKAKMAQAEEAQRAEVARLMETLTPAQALPYQQQPEIGWD